MIGDPSGRNATRPSLTLKETREHGESLFSAGIKNSGCTKNKDSLQL